MDAETTIRDYYDALRQGEPLAGYFLDDESTVKIGVSETLSGGESVRNGLDEQSQTTDEWTVDSTDLTVEERAEFAWFVDEVTLAWTDRTTGSRYLFNTRWTGTLVRAPPSERLGTDQEDESGRTDSDWAFVSMHVSAPREL